MLSVLGIFVLISPMPAQAPSVGKLCVRANGLCKVGQEVTVSGKIERFEETDPFGLHKDGLQMILRNSKSEIIKVYLGSTWKPDLLTQLKNKGQVVSAVGFEIDFNKSPLVLAKELFDTQKINTNTDWSKFYQWLPSGQKP